MDHPYCYPGTDVYRNKENIRDRDELEAFERQHSADRLLTLPHDLPITVDGYRQIHRYMLQRTIVDAFAASPSAGVVGGVIVDRPHLARAQRLLARTRSPRAGRSD